MKRPDSEVSDTPDQLEILPSGLATVYISRDPDRPQDMPIIHYLPERDPEAVPLLFALPKEAYPLIMVKMMDPTSQA